MRGFEGEGGKNQRRRKKPQTAQGRAFLQDVELGSQQFIRTLDPQPTNPSPHNENTGQLYGLEDDENRYKGQEADGLPDPEAVDIRVQRLQAYLQSQDYIERKLLEEKQWEEVYDGMFLHFYECASKTASWGNPNNWDHNWKPPCECAQPRSRPVVLVDLLS
ncbi:hypothetical protein PTTG_26449 [Puccinia triticina 1-1 BBBD Race 1]|uniref:Uncharacterized protein n=1 Tax=Puccinia triticina (isolate 1-1 / race 1 (BBBD)) TaxID=630390 RepID=A0A180GTB5_PUCT1|nr:hypothetical protein PTTG_26449 [Puccinia triticina 1-1 BBBD Race 1]